jgi:ketosteroid isomerase-like protein
MPPAAWALVGTRVTWPARHHRQVWLEEAFMRAVAAIVLSVIVLGGPRLTAQAAQAAPPDPKAFEPVGALSNGVQARDASLTASAYADDALLLPPNGETVRGRPAIEAFWKQQYGGGFNAVDGASNGLTTSGDLGYEWGTATFESQAGNQTAVDVTKYVNVLKKDAAGTWKIAMTIWNSSKPR